VFPGVERLRQAGLRVTPSLVRRACTALVAILHGRATPAAPDPVLSPTSGWTGVLCCCAVQQSYGMTRPERYRDLLPTASAWRSVQPTAEDPAHPTHRDAFDPAPMLGARSTHAPTAVAS
jgi:hypothetical protein